MSQPPEDQPDFVMANQEAAVGANATAPDPHQVYPAVEEPTKKSKTPAIIAGVVALALIVGGALVAMNLLRGGTAVAAKGIPATAGMVFELNLKPAAADQLALKDIAAKFPQVEVKETTDYKEALWELIPDESDKPDYAEIQPWLGDSAAVGLVIEDDLSEPSPVLAIHVTDKAKAEAFFTKEADDALIFFVDDVIVVADKDSGLTADAIKGSSVADNADYTADMAKLTGTHLATMWMSSAFMDTAIDNATETAPEVSADALEAARGMRIAAALQASEYLLTMRMLTVTPNAPETGTLPDVVEFAKGLDGGSLVTVAMGLSRETVENGWEQAKQVPEFEQGREMLSSIGITGPDDLLALLGSQIGFSVGMEAGQPVVGAKLQSDNPARQAELFDGFRDLLLESGGEGITLKQVDGIGVIAFGQGTDQVLNPATRLGDIESFAKVIDGKSQTLVYANLDAIFALPEIADLTAEADEWTRALSAVGMTSNVTGPGEAETLVRVAFK